MVGQNSEHDLNYLKVRSTIGKLSIKEGTSKSHHGTFDEEDVKNMKAKVAWEGRSSFYVNPMVYRYIALYLPSTEEMCKLVLPA